MSFRNVLTSVSVAFAMVLSSHAMAQQRAPGGGGGGGGVAGGEGAPIAGRAQGGAAGGIGGGGRVAPRLPRVQIGIAMDRVPDALVAHVDVQADDAVLIVNVFEGGAAERAGVERFDIITHLDGQSPVSQELIRQTLRAKEPGDEIALRVLRGGESRDITVTLEEAEPLAARGGGFAGGRLTPEQLQQLPRGNVYAPPGMLDQAGNIYMTREQQHQLRQQFQRQWREHQPEIEEHLHRLRAEMAALRETLAREWREHVREFQIDEETREKVRQWTERAAERVAEAINRAFETVDDVEIQIDVQAPRVQILRDGRERGMIVQPDQRAQRPRLGREREREAELSRLRAMLEALGDDHPHAERLRESLEQARLAEREESQQRGEAIENRLNSVEDRLERIEHMMRRLVEREAQE